MTVTSFANDIDVETPTEVDRAYAAGYFDGEGCVRISTRTAIRGKSVLYRLVVQVTQNERETLDWIASRWGGKVRARRPRENGKVPHDWNCSGPVAADFLRDIRPHLRGKAAQADLALAFQSLRYNPGGAGLPPEVTAEYQRMSEQMAAMKHMAGQHPEFVTDHPVTEAGAR